MNKKKKQVIVGLSGGVDSSTTAFLLKKKGFNVKGVSLHLSGEKQNLDKLSKALDIPIKVIDVQSEFKNKIIDYFLKEYKKGNTPNPCVICNNKIKTSFLLKELEKQNADFIATGHYVLREKTKQGYQLLKAKDKKKDQSYFLWQLTQKKLKKTLFPLGGFKKEKIKEIAQENNIPVKPDESQDVCFIRGETKDFLKEKLGESPGRILDEKGNVLGEHKGSFLFTIGQRKGIGLSNGPWFVKEKKGKDIIVTKDKEKLLQKEFKIKNINWITKQLNFPFEATVKIRYNSPSSPCIIKPKGKIILKEPKQAITPGQSAVFYKKDKLLGGGIIYEE